MWIGMVSSSKEQKGPQEAGREREMCRIQKPVVCYLTATSKALILSVGLVLKCRYFKI